MTSRELLNCLKDRPCSVCKLRDENGCHKWECVFEEEPDNTDVSEAYRQGYIDSGIEIYKHMTDNDAISRSDALNAVVFGSKEDMQAKIIELPNVYPARKSSEWVYNFQSDKHYCKNCNAERPATDYAFCPKCGADMRPEPYKAESEE